MVLYLLINYYYYYYSDSFIYLFIYSFIIIILIQIQYETYIFQGPHCNTSSKVNTVNTSPSISVTGMHLQCWPWKMYISYWIWIRTRLWQQQNILSLKHIEHTFHDWFILRSHKYKQNHVLSLHLSLKIWVQINFLIHHKYMW